MPTLLIVSPHPDDEVLYCAGLVRKAVGLGFRVCAAYLTAGHNGHTLGIVEKNDLWKARIVEAKNAAQKLDITDTYFLNYEDFAPETKKKSHWTGVKDRLLAWGGQYKREATLIVAFPPNGMNGHPDHVRASALTTGLANALSLPLAYVTSEGLMQYPEKEGFMAIARRQALHLVPTHKVCLSEREVAAKLEAMACYETQALSILGYIRRNKGDLSSEFLHIKNTNKNFEALFSPI